MQLPDHGLLAWRTSCRSGCMPPCDDASVVKSPPQPWSCETLRATAAVLGDTENGLTGREIGDLLGRLKMGDPTPAASKRDRLTAAFAQQQSRDGSARRVVTFVVEAMRPVRYRDRPEIFTLRQDRLNERLAFEGLRIGDDGQMRNGPQARTLDEATRIATSLRDELVRRSTHPRVLEYCSVEVLKKDHFHACLEAAKSVFEHLREVSGLSGDGAKLVDEALAPGKGGVPVIAINSMATVTERDEQAGFSNLVKGIHGLYRNPVAHDPRLRRDVSEPELLEALTLISMVHRRLDARAWPPPPWGGRGT